MKFEATTKEVLSYIAAYASLTIGFGLLIAGFCVPPVGEIDNSVQLVFAQILVFAGSILGIALHVDNKMGMVKGEIKREVTDYVERRSLETEKKHLEGLQFEEK